jgi:hypothetical protein
MEPMKLVLALAVLLSACLEQGPGASAPSGAGDPRGIVVIGSDYVSTSVSLLDAEAAALAASDLLHSGSAAPGLSVALSGDVVPASSPAPDALIALIDRYPSGVLTLLTPEGTLRAQLNLATGFAANVQDVLWVDADRLWASRLETNPTPGRQAFDGGDDVVIVTPSTGEVVGRIALAPLAGEAGGHPLQVRPTRFARAGARVFVALAHLAADFSAAGPGLVAELDPALEAVVERVELPGVRNCTNLLALDERTLLVTCSGLLAAGTGATVEGSGLVTVDTAESPSRAALLRSSTDGGGQEPFGFEVAAIDGWVLVVRFGDLATERPDRLVAFRLADPAGPEVVVHQAESAFGLGGLLADPARGRLYVGEASREAPRVQVYRVTEAGFTAEKELATHPETGLPPRAIGWY